MKHDTTRPLEGIRVLDLSRLLPAPAATFLLSAFGADVVKVEDIANGDRARRMPPNAGPDTGLFEQVNRGKRSAAIDLKSSSGRSAFLRLVPHFDVLVEGFRPGTMDRLGLGYETLRRHNVGLVYVAVSGYGQTGPYKDLAGHDLNYLALTGALDALAGGGEPHLPGLAIADMTAALFAVTGTLLALQSRNRSGQGQFVDVALADAAVWQMAFPLAYFGTDGLPPRVGQTVLTGGFAYCNTYPTSDGRAVAVAAGEPRFWARLCTTLGCNDFVGEQHAALPRQVEMRRRFGAVFLTRTADEWGEIFRDSDSCVTPVRDLASLGSDEHFQARGVVQGSWRIGPQPLLRGTPGRVVTRAPVLGEHTHDVLKEAGLSDAELSELARQGAVRVVQTSQSKTREEGGGQS